VRLRTMAALWPLGSRGFALSKTVQGRIRVAEGGLDAARWGHKTASADFV